jgi:uncharacterized surface protein with fasciclin (FAS1) repeats
MICASEFRRFHVYTSASREVVMKTNLLAVVVATALVAVGCEKRESAEPEASSAKATQEVSNIPPLDPNNIVSLAVASKDHTILVEAIKSADYVTSVAASGPLTVFAPTNAAFEKLPEGTVQNLLEPENIGQLRKILQYHVTTSALGADSFTDGQTLGMANGKKATIHVQDGALSINDAKIIASAPASNGMLHIIDTVLIPPES